MINKVLLLSSTLFHYSAIDRLQSPSNTDYNLSMYCKKQNEGLIGRAVLRVHEHVSARGCRMAGCTLLAVGRRRPISMGVYFAINLLV